MATDLREVLLAIREEHGRLTPKIVVEAARDPGSPIHSKFVWDDTKAAELFRESQAAELLRSVKISYSTGEDRLPTSIRAFHATSSPEFGHHYAPIEEILDDPVQRQLLLRDMQRDWITMKQRYEHLIEFWETISSDLELVGNG